MSDRHIYFAPLSGLRFQGDAIRLEPDLEISLLTDREREMCRDFPGTGFATHAVHLVEECTVEPEHCTSEADDLIRKVYLAVNALRLFQRGDFSASLVMDYLESGDWKRFRYGREPIRLLPSGYSLNTEDQPSLEGFWASRRSSLVGRPLAYAIDSFSSACSHGSTERALVDLTIAAEAIFLTEVADEAKYRLSLRAAYLIADEPDKRRYFFNHFKEVYDVRSWIVHGKTRGTPKCLRQLMKGSAVRTEEKAIEVVVSSFEDIIRGALVKATELAERGEWPPDWESMVLGA